MYERQVRASEKNFEVLTLIFTSRYLGPLTSDLLMGPGIWDHSFGSRDGGSQNLGPKSLGHSTHHLRPKCLGHYEALNGSRVPRTH